MNKEFEKICKMSQKELKKYIVGQLKKANKNVISEDGFVYADGDFPVLLVAHLDTVHEKLPESILYDLQTNTVSSPNGIGGDDRCGIYMILEIIKKHKCSVLFCEDEEKGGIGAKKFVEEEFAKELGTTVVSINRWENGKSGGYLDDRYCFVRFGLEHE